MKYIFSFIFLLCFCTAYSQVEIVKLVGKGGSDFKIGYGGSLKLGYQVSDASYINLDIALYIFQEKENPEYGYAIAPLKAGYRYTLNGSGKGFYVEPQLGYTVYGLTPDEEKFKGFVWSAGVGYLLGEGKGQYDIGLRYESVLVSGGSISYVGLRFSKNFVLGRKNAGDK
jgi:hypothetical protein